METRILWTERDTISKEREGWKCKAHGVDYWIRVVELRDCEVDGRIGETSAF